MATPTPKDVYPPDFTSSRGRVRALLPDVEQVDFSGEGVPEYLFSDAHIDAFLATSRGGPRSRILRAAAMGLRAIATTEGLISKVIKTEDLQTDGAKLAAALFKGAEGFDQQADDTDEEEDDWMYGFQIVDFQPQPVDGYSPWMRGFPSCGGCGGGSPSSRGGCGCGSTDHGAGFGRWV